MTHVDACWLIISLSNCYLNSHLDPGPRVKIDEEVKVFTYKQNDCQWVTRKIWRHIALRKMTEIVRHLTNATR